MSEKLIQEGLQAAIQSMDEFIDADVVINDWDVLDQPGARNKAPFVIIQNSDDWETRQDVMTPQDKWQIKLTLIEAFIIEKGWKFTEDNFRDRRQALLDKFNSGTVRSAGGLSGVTIDRFYPIGPISDVYNRYMPEAEVSEAIPEYRAQTFGADCEEY